MRTIIAWGNQLLNVVEFLLYLLRGEESVGRNKKGSLGSSTNIEYGIWKEEETKS